MKRKRAYLLAAALLTLTPAGCKRTGTQPPPSGAVRLVSTAPNLTEIVFAIGAGNLLVGRTDVCDYPPDAAHVPITGAFAKPWIEPLLAAHPTHVLESALADTSAKNHLDALGIPLVHVACSSLDDIPNAILQLGGLTGHATQAQALAAHIRAGLAEGSASRPHPRPRVLLLFAPEPLITAGGGTFISEMLTLAGGDNVAAGVSKSEYFQVADEWLMRCDPDIILCLFDTQGRDPVSLFASRTGWQSLNAMRERRVKTVAGLDTVLRPGPRVLEGLAQLEKVIGDK